jgi:hypothetical protein
MGIGIEDPVVALAGLRVVELPLVDHEVGTELADEI